MFYSACFISRMYRLLTPACADLRTCVARERVCVCVCVCMRVCVCVCGGGVPVCGWALFEEYNMMTISLVIFDLSIHMLLLIMSCAKSAPLLVRLIGRYRNDCHAHSNFRY